MNPPRLRRLLSCPHAFLLAFTLPVLLLLSGCASTPGSDSAPRQPSWISLQRTTSASDVEPAYLLTVFDDGRVLFEGHSAVKSKGTFSKRLSAADVRPLFDRVEAVNIWDREPRYDVERVNQGGDSVIARVAPTDAPWDIITVRHRGRFKRIDGLFFAPRELRDLKTLIEQTVDLAAWIGGPSRSDE